MDCIRPRFLFSLALQFYEGPIMAYAKHHFSIASHCLFRYGEWRAIRQCLTQATHNPTKNALLSGWVLRFRSLTFSSTHSSYIFVSFFLKFKSIDWHLVFTWFFGRWIRIGMISLTEERSAWAAYRQEKGIVLIYRALIAIFWLSLIVRSMSKIVHEHISLKTDLFQKAPLYLHALFVLPLR